MPKKRRTPKKKIIRHTLSDGTTVDLADLNKDEQDFYWQVVKRFQKKQRWIEFSNFALSMKSLIYSKRRRKMYPDPDREDPLAAAVKDMGAQLGKEQGFF